MSDFTPTTVGGVRIFETVWIRLSDGVRLAARLWMPESSETNLVPAILEYLPYRRRDRHRSDDSFTHPYFAARGYAAIRVDMRGSGDSEGLLFDEYTPQEWSDACEVIAWIAEQPWCDGRVGMMGLSWSGFNSLQVAARRPPALKAIISVCASDDRYSDDMHYMGGCLLHDNLQYGATLFTWLAMPPDPQVVGERWREIWLERLEAVSPPALRWMQHRDFDDYWKSGSVACDYAAITVPVLAVGGWSDGYRNAVMRLLRNLGSPRKGLIGPWSHAFPHVATPGPKIDFLAYATRWWDHWLRDLDTGIMQEPMLTCWLQQSEPPRSEMQVRQGRWIAEAHWPSDNIGLLRFGLSSRSLDQSEPHFTPEPFACIASPTDVGLESGEWCPYGIGPDLPLDQRYDDAGSATFDTEPLQNAFQILGRPRIMLRLAADATEAIVAVRLNDVSSEGVSRRITYGLLNLAHRGGHSVTRPLSPGNYYDVDLSLNAVGYEVPAGNRVRLAVSSAYWPLAVGAPRQVRLDIFGGFVELPLRQGEGPAPTALGTADVPASPEARSIRPPSRGRMRITRDLRYEMTTVYVVRTFGRVALTDVDLEMHVEGSESYRMPWRTPAAANATTERAARLRRAGWEVEVKTATALSFQGSSYSFTASIEASENGGRVFDRCWQETVPRGAASVAGNQTAQKQTAGRE